MHAANVWQRRVEQERAEAQAQLEAHRVNTQREVANLRRMALDEMDQDVLLDMALRLPLTPQDAETMRYLRAHSTDPAERDFRTSSFSS